MIYADAIRGLFVDEHIVASGQVSRSSPAHVGTCDAVRLLLAVTKIGSPGGSESITVRPIFVDERGDEYLDANTTYGTFAVLGNAAPTNLTVYIPYPTPVMGLKVTGAGSLAVGTEIVVSARYVPIRRAMEP
jgi:hypothetical protein